MHPGHGSSSHMTLLSRRDSTEVCLSFCPITSEDSQHWLPGHEDKNLSCVQLRWENILFPHHQDFSNEKHMFLVHNSLILVFPVVNFLAQNTESLDKAFANNSMIVES